MSVEAVINPFVISIDIVQEALNFQQLADFLKTNYKKDVVIINANDFPDTSPTGRQSKLEPGRQGDPRTRGRSVQGLVKNIKQRMDTDIAKALEAKKKLLAQLEKQRQAAAAGRLKGKAPKISAEVPHFEGKIDLVFIIQNFPYLPSQLSALIDAGVDFNAFVALVPQCPKDRPVTNQDVKAVQENLNASPPRKGPKKPVLNGVALDYTNCSACYPPARWTAMKPTAPLHVSFLEIPVVEDIAMVWKSFEEKMIEIFDSREEFDNFLFGRKVVPIPAPRVKQDMTIFKEYLDAMSGDFINGLYFQLAAHQWETADPPPTPSKKQVYEQVFANSGMNRKVLWGKQDEPEDPVFEFKTLPEVMHLFRILEEWKVTYQTAYQTVAMCNFLQKITNIVNYSGQKFDQMFAMINKKYQLGLPLAYFDWQKWNMTTIHFEAAEVLANALAVAKVVECQMDPVSGLLYVMTMRPIHRTRGGYLAVSSMPRTLLNFDDWLVNIYEDDGAGRKSSRSARTPASVRKTGGDMRTLLAPIQSLYQNKENSLYRLPSILCRTTDFITPYFFESGLEVEITRRIINEEMKLSFEARVDKLLSFFSTENSFVLVSEDRLRIYIDEKFGVSLIFNEDSIYYDREKIMLMPTGVCPYVITNNGSVIVPEKDGPSQPLIVSCNGNVYHREGDTMTYVDTEGRKFKRNADGEYEEMNCKHAKVVDVGTGVTTVVRPDTVRLMIESDGSRKYEAGDVSIVHGKNDTISVDIPDYPVTSKSVSEGENVLDFALNRYSIKMRKSKVEVSCDDFVLVVLDNAVDLTIGKNTCHLTLDKYEFKYEDQVLVVSQDGTERMGHLTTEKPKNKKIELISSVWGDVAPPVKASFTEQEQLTLHKLFRPRFFAIRGDGEAFEFCRKDDLDFTDRRVYTNPLKLHTGELLELVTAHTMETKTDFYFHIEPLSKLDRVNLLKSVHPQKLPKKLEPGDLETIEAFGADSHRAWLDGMSTFDRILETSLDDAEQQYLSDVTPKTPPPEEILPIPPHTPCPRLLTMQQDSYDRHVGQKDLEYWASHESDFGYPLDMPRREETPLSPRTKLFDPPRSQEKYPMEVEVEQPRAVSVQKVRKEVVQEKTRPKTAQANRSQIDFGEVKVGDKKRLDVSVKNTGFTPLKFICSLMKSPMFRVVTVSGMISPGLSEKVVVEFAPTSEGIVEDKLVVRTASFELAFPVIGKVIVSDEEKKDSSGSHHE